MCAKYLGFQVGPQCDDHLLAQPCLKTQLRVASWQWCDLGLHYAARVSNALTLSTFQIMAQLAAAPSSALAVEAALLRKAAPGPGNWCRPTELWHLRSHYGFPVAFRNLALVGLASLARVHRFENRLQGSLQAERRSRLLWHWRCTSRYQRRVDRWDSRHCAAPVTILTDAAASRHHPDGGRTPGRWRRPAPLGARGHD